jgi:hypothetical protein
MKIILQNKTATAIKITMTLKIINLKTGKKGFKAKSKH